MPRFQSIIRRARFVYSPFTAYEMQVSAQVLADSIRVRIQSGQNIYDQAAAPLKPGKPGRRGYPDYKSARGLQPIRDWTWSGHTLRCLKVLTANENRAAIGFLDEAMPGRRQTASQIAAISALPNACASFPVLEKHLCEGAQERRKGHLSPHVLLFKLPYAGSRTSQNVETPGVPFENRFYRGNRRPKPIPKRLAIETEERLGVWGGKFVRKVGTEESLIETEGVLPLLLVNGNSRHQARTIFWIAPQWPYR